MLIASVKYGTTLEAQLKADLELGADTDALTTYISKEVTPLRSATVASTFYIVIALVVLVFLGGSFLPRTTGGGPSRETTGHAQGST